MIFRGARIVPAAVAACLGAALLQVSPLAAQRYRAFEASVSPVTIETAAGVPSAGGVFLASAVIPGAGQYRLGAGRWVAYAGVEAWAWINWLDKRSETHDLERAYRDLAWFVARRIGVGPRDDPEFEYFEAMSHYDESGAWDVDPVTAGIQPEMDTLTFNGDLWQLAQQIFLPADTIPPTAQERAAALAYYEERAITPQLAWSWGANGLEQEQFRSLIRRSDDAARASTTFLGVILVNHVVSAVDALITARLRTPGSKLEGLRLRGETRPTRFGPRSFLVIELATP